MSVTAVFLTVMVLTILGIKFVGARRRRLPMHATRREPAPTRPVIENASEVLVWITFDGLAQELTDDRKKIVDAPFALADGDRPYLKSSFDEKNGWGRLDGYLLRKDVPDGVTIHPAPIIPRALDGT
jgi:hypothetical protein